MPCAVITAHGNVESAVRALKLGAFDFVSKPLDLGVLRRIVSTALKLSQSSDAAVSTRTGTQLIGGAPAMDRLREMILRVSRSQAPVHIYGESGTGKELVARMIHASGPRAEGPFVPVNCGAIPSELMESEFFGHKRGSFTGAVTDKIGLIPSAEGGTLFLDEVADLPLHMQVKLLRVIQEKTVRPIGEQREAPIDVRILSATHKNLARAGGAVRSFAKTCSTASTSSSCACRRCASAPRTFPISPMPSCAGCRAGWAWTAGHQLPRRSTCCRTSRFPATCASWRTCWSARWRCATTDVSRWAICSCAPCRAENAPLPSAMAIAAMRSPAAASNAAAEHRPPGALGDQLEDVERAAIVKALEAGALQQDRGGQGAGHDVSRTALSHQEARNRVTQSDVQRHFVTLSWSADVRIWPTGLG